MAKETVRIGVIGIPGAWSSELLRTSFKKLEQKRQFEKYSFEVDIFSISELVYDVNHDVVSYKSKSLKEYDAIIIKKLGEYAPRILDWLDMLSNIEKQGVPFFSSPQKLRRMISRIGCTRMLGANAVPMPETIITESSEDALEWIKQKHGAVFKPNFSTKARGMEILNEENCSIEKLDALKNEYSTLYLQELLDLPGQDYGVVFSGGEYIATYARVGSKDSWNTTTRDGGHYASYNPDETILEMAHKAQAIFGLDFCCVDVAESTKGAIVFEVSAFGGFKGLYEGVGINSADLLSEYIMKKIGKQ